MRIVLVRGTLASRDSRASKARRALERAGHEVDVLDWDFRRERPRAVEGRERHFRVPAARGSWKVLAAVPIWWAWIFARLLFRRWDAVHACDLDTLPPAVAAAALRRKLVVHDVFDWYPDMLAGKVPRFAERALRGLYALLLPRVDALVIADEARAAQVAPRVPDAIVMNAPEDAGRAAPGSGSPAGKLRVFYAGLLRSERALDTLLDAVADEKAIEVDLAGYGPAAREIESRVARMANARFLGPLPYEEVIRRSRDADALVAFYDPASPNNRLASPNKLYEAMMLARPIVTNAGILAGERAERLGTGLVVPYGDAAALRAALLRLAGDPALRARLGEAGRREYDLHYAWSTMEARLSGVYAELSARERKRGPAAGKRRERAARRSGSGR